MQPDNHLKRDAKKSTESFLLHVEAKLHAINHRYQIVRWLLTIFLILFLTLSIYMVYIAKTMDVQNMHSSLEHPTIIYDNNNHKAGELYAQKGHYTSLKHISNNLPNVILSTEDRNFYHEHGFSVRGFSRAVFLMLKNKLLHRNYISGGGSTLTQQLVKNTYLSQEQTFNRKLKELFMSVQVANVYSKHQILSMYMNRAYFGNGVYGVQDASERYFGCSAAHLSVQDSAVLAGMLTNPGIFNPINHPTLCKERRNMVLDLMAQNHKLTQGQANYYKAKPVQVKNNYVNHDHYKYPYYFDSVISEALNKYGISESDLMNHGYRIYTTMNQKQQKAMQRDFKDKSNFPHNANDGTKVQAASIAMNPHSGGVTALIGGRGKHLFQGYDRATQMLRQPGSTIKPLAVYTPALEDGFSYDSKLSNTPHSYHGYRPLNVDRSTSGSVAAYKALAQSMNVPTVWLLHKIGVDRGYESAKQFGLPVTKRDKNLALGLGGMTKGVSPAQLASAYTAFANNGVRTSPFFIKKIVNASGKVIVDNTHPDNTHQVMDPTIAKEMTSMMLGVFDEGTGASAKPAGYSIAGKTGSTQADRVGDATADRDKWIVGYTPDVVVATWEGFDKTNRGHHLENLGGTTIGTLYKTEMQDIIPTTKETSFKVKDADDLSDFDDTKFSSNGWNIFQRKAAQMKVDFGDGVNTIKHSADQFVDKLDSFF